MLKKIEVNLIFMFFGKLENVLNKWKNEIVLVRELI